MQERKSVVQPGTILSICDDPDLQLMCAKNYVADKMPSQAPSTGGAGTHSEQREKICLAYLSTDFRRHAMAYLITRLLEVHDRSRFKVIGISVGRDDASDERQRIIAAVDEFHSVEAKSDREIARLIHECDIDILIDLIGHTEGGRLGILAQRPAPVQASYIGYPGTTGAAFIDYLITDEIVVPDENQRFYSENIVRLPSCYLAYDPGGKTLSATPTRAEVGLPERGFVFCSFNNSYKIRPTVFDTWMRLLRAVEGSVLWLIADNPAAEANLRKEAAQRGVDPSRLVFAERVGLSEHLSRHRLADLFLDTLPYNAHTTACDALWMGLPLVTCAGQ
ncbi:MAG: hypothetical protein WBW73_12285, partial [Rhodoplanes sp.]